MAADFAVGCNAGDTALGQDAVIAFNGYFAFTE
jgi:hypothetical protein